MTPTQERASDFLDRHKWDNQDWRTAHREHTRHPKCAICTGDLTRIVVVVSYLVDSERAAAKQDVRRELEESIGVMLKRGEMPSSKASRCLTPNHYRKETSPDE